MNKSTSAKLDQLNLQLYNEKSQHFDLTRQYQWRGWQRLIPLFANNNSLKILDLGCGNGRFIEALRQQNANFTYTGVDASTKLIKIARTKYTANTINFVNQEIIAYLQEDTQTYDLIVLFGVLHHFSLKKRKQELFKLLSQHLSKDSNLIFTTWNFDQLKLFTKRLNADQINKLGINPASLGTDDYLLPWDNSDTVYRYCHLFNEDEIKNLASLAKLSIKQTFLEDGKNSKTNTYYVLAKSLS